jgi:hypothetical protein
VGFLDALLGRTKPVPPNLDALFTVPPAALTMEATFGLRPTGTGAVCFRTAEGPAAAATGREIEALLNGDLGTRTTVTNDEYGYTWITCTREDADIPALVTDLHMVNSSLVDAGLGQGLLCTVLAFHASPDSANPASRVELVYLYKRGTFYPFAPTGPDSRDNQTELAIRGALSDELRMEPDLSRWYAVWNAPGL